MTRFIGRKRELETLSSLAKKKSASLVVLKGRRRIGKSRLVQEFGRGSDLYTFTGLPPTQKTTKESQLNEFSNQLCRNLNLPNLRFSDWNDMFWFLADQVKGKNVILFFDEISWMGYKDPDFLGKLKTAWDLRFKENDNLILILCGSVSAWIERNILRSTGFMGRISSVITLDELSLVECNEFWNNNDISAFEKFKVLSVTGGIPRYLEELRPELSAEQNIKTICFNKEGFLFSEFDQIFADVFITRSELYKKIITCLSGESLEPSEICHRLGVDLNNAMSDYFEELTQAGFISRDFTWHINTHTDSKLSHYRLKDNYLRFYLKYILPNKNKINSGSFNDKSLTVLPAWSSIMGLQFENLVLQNKRRLWEKLNLSPDEIVCDGPFFQKKTVKQPGCQIDYLIQTRFGTLYICEIKFLGAAVKNDTILDVKNKITSLKKPKSFSIRPVLIHVNGVDPSVQEQGYFSEIIDFSEFISS